MLACYACRQPYPSSFEWCEKCKAPLLRPYQPNSLKCSQCNTSLINVTRECPVCATHFSTKILPELTQLPNWYTWDERIAKQKAQQLLGNQQISDLSIKHFIGLSYSLKKEGKAQEAYATASIAATRLKETNKDLSLLDLALRLAKLFIELKKPGDVMVSLLQFEPLIPQADQFMMAGYYEMLGISYLELGFHPLAQELLQEALSRYIESGSYEAWFKAASNLFMSYMGNGDREGAVELMAEMLKVLNSRFLEPFRDDLIPVAFYLFNQLFWSTFQVEELPQLTPTEKNLVKTMKGILRAVLEIADLRFAHFIDFDRVLVAVLVAGFGSESEKIVNKLLALAGDNSDEKGAVLLKWMGALHLTGNKEQESSVWKQIQNLLPHIKEQSIRNAIVTFQLRENIAALDAKYYNVLEIFPEEYSIVNLSRPSLLERSKYLPFEPLETHLGVSIVFPKKALSDLIRIIKKHSKEFHVFPYIISLGKHQQKLALDSETLESIEVLAILIKKEGKIWGFEFISLPKPRTADVDIVRQDREYQLFGYVQKPDKTEAISNKLLASLKNISTEVSKGTVHVYINHPKSLPKDAVFRSKGEKA